MYTNSLNNRVNNRTNHFGLIENDPLEVAIDAHKRSEAIDRIARSAEQTNYRKPTTNHSPQTSPNYNIRFGNHPPSPPLFFPSFSTPQTPPPFYNSRSHLHSNTYATDPSSPSNRNRNQRDSTSSNRGTPPKTTPPKKKGISPENGGSPSLSYSNSPSNLLEIHSPNELNPINNQAEHVDFETYVNLNFPTNTNELSDLVRFYSNFVDYLQEHIKNKTIRMILNTRNITLDKNFKELFQKFIKAGHPGFIKLILESFVPTSMHWEIDSDFFMALPEIYLSEGKIDKALEILEYRISQEKVQLSPFFDLSIQTRCLDILNTPTNRHLKLGAFHECITKLKTTLAAEDLWKLPFIEGKYYHLANDQTNFNTCVDKIEQLIDEKPNEIGSILKLLKNFFLITQSERVLLKAIERWKHPEVLGKNLKLFLEFAFFDEYLGKESSDIDRFYHSFIQANRHKQQIKYSIYSHIHFLARRGACCFGNAFLN